MDSFPLLALPPEIREEIYRAVLVPHRPIRPHHFGTNRNALLCTCRQIYAEAAPILYTSPIKLADHADYFTGSDFIQMWLRRINRHHRAILRRLDVDFASACSYQSLESSRPRGTDQQHAYGRSCIFGFCSWRTESRNMVTALEEGNARYIDSCLRLIASHCRQLWELRVLLPSSSQCLDDRYAWVHYGVFNDHPEIRQTLGKLKRLKRLTIGYTLDIEVVDRMAEKMGVTEVEVQWRRRDWDEMFDYLKVDPYELHTPQRTEYKNIRDAVAKWRKSGWKLPKTIWQEAAGSAFKTFSRS